MENWNPSTGYKSWRDTRDSTVSEYGHGEDQPGQYEGQAAKGCNGSEPADITQGHHVKTA